MFNVERHKWDVLPEVVERDIPTREEAEEAAANFLEGAREHRAWQEKGGWVPDEEPTFVVVAQ